MNVKPLNLIEGKNVRRSMRNTTDEIIIIAENITKKKAVKRKRKSSQENENKKPGSSSCSPTSMNNENQKPLFLEAKPSSQIFEGDTPSVVVPKVSLSSPNVLNTDVNVKKIKNEEGALKKKSTQQSIFSFVKTMDRNPSKKDKEEVLKVYNEALESIKNRKYHLFKKAINSARRCMKSTINECITSKCFKYYISREQTEKLLSDGEDPVNIYEEWLNLFQKGYFEDTVLHSDQLFNFKIVPKGFEKYSYVYGKCLQLSEFLITFEHYLQSKAIFSAKSIFEAMLKGYEGYYSLTSLILVAFLHGFKSCRVLSMLKFGALRLSDINFNYKSAGEIIKMLVIRKPSFMNENRDIPFFNVKIQKIFFQPTPCELPEPDTELVERLEKVEFYELSIDDQLKVFDFLMDICYLTDEFHAHFDEQLKPNSENLISLLEEKRMTKDPKKLSKINGQIRELELLKMKYKVFYHYKNRVVFLGTDRYHRKYYLFDKSVNSGVYVVEESVYSSKLNDNCEIKNDELANELSRLFDFTPMKEIEKPKWYHIETADELKSLLKTLNSKGIREHKLIANISYWKTEIEKQMKRTVMKTKSLKQYKPSVIVYRDFESLINYCLNKNLFYSSANMKKYRNLKIDDEENPFQFMLDAFYDLVNFLLPGAFIREFTYKPSNRRRILLQYVKNITTWSQMAFAMHYIQVQLMKNKITTEKCVRCNERLNNRGKITSCVECKCLLHIECLTEIEESLSPFEPGWKCKTCRVGAGEIIDESEEEIEQESEEEEDEEFVIGGKTLRSTEFRKQRNEELLRPDSGMSMTSSEFSVKNSKGRKRRIVYSDESDIDTSEVSLTPTPEPVPEVLARYEEFIKDYRILQSLSVVAFQGLDGITITIIGLKKILYKISTVSLLNKLFYRLWTATNKYYERNARKYESLKEHFKKFLDIIDNESDRNNKDNDNNECFIEENEKIMEDTEITESAPTPTKFLSLDDSNHAW